MCQLSRLLSFICTRHTLPPHRWSPAWSTTAQKTMSQSWKRNTDGRCLRGDLEHDHEAIHEWKIVLECHFFAWQYSTFEVIQSIAPLCPEATFVLAAAASRTWAKRQKSGRERFSLKFVEVPLADNKSCNWKECYRNEFPKQAANADHMPTVQCGYLVTFLPLSNQPVCTHSHRHALQPHPNNSLQNRKTLGDWHPPSPICPCTPHSPLLHPLPLTPSAADHCLLSLSFTALLV